MKHYLTVVVGCVLCGFGAASARADCQTELAAYETAQVPNTGGISKDGTLAPLQDPTAPMAQPNTSSSPPASESTSSGSSTSGGVAKDGSMAPLGTNPSQAMSGQDAQAQQEGHGTAAQEAQNSSTDAVDENADRDRAIAEAKAALLAGNEEACLAALQKISGS